MSQQLQLPLFPEGLFEKVRAAYGLQELVKLQKENEHLTHVIAGFKGARTKRKHEKEQGSHLKKDQETTG